MTRMPPPVSQFKLPSDAGMCAGSPSILQFASGAIAMFNDIFVRAQAAIAEILFHLEDETACLPVVLSRRLAKALKLPHPCKRCQKAPLTPERCVVDCC